MSFRSLCLAVPVLALLAGGAAAEPVLRSAVIVDAPVIRLGDLFADSGPAAGATIATAPAPGTRVVYDSAWLAARAREQHLAWQPRSRFDTVTVERASKTIEADAIAAELARELGDRLQPRPVELRLDNAALRLFVPAGDPAAIAVDGLTYDPASGRVSAYVAPADGDPAAQRIRVTGHVYHMVDMPVLTRAMAPDQIIAAGDIDTIAMRRERLNQDYILAAADLVGKAPRRMLLPGMPVRADDVQAPLVVHRNDLVAIVLQLPAMVITAQGQALDDGALGQTIRVSNTQSKRVLDVRVTGPGNVALVMPAALTAP